MAEAHIVAIGDPPCLSRWLDQAEADRLAATLRQSFPGALVTSKAVENTLFSAGEAERDGVPAGTRKCDRCDGTGSVITDDEEWPCPQCAGNGVLASPNDQLEKPR